MSFQPIPEFQWPGHFEPVFLNPGDCDRCSVPCTIRVKVRDVERQVGWVCGICAWLVSLGRTLQPEATCRVCGCTDSAACPTGCSWIELDRAAGTGLCSNCEGKEAA